MKNLATCCLPEMANHRSIKIRVGKKAERAQRAPELGDDSTLPFFSCEIKKKCLKKEIVKGIFERVLIFELKTTSLINLVQEKCFQYPLLTDDPKI